MGKALQRRPMNQRGKSSNWRPRWPAWKESWGGGAWKQVFSKVPCEKSRGYSGRAKSLAEYHLRRDQRLGIARPNEHPADVRAYVGEPGQFLSGLGAEGARRGRDGTAGRGPANGAGQSGVWISADHAAGAACRGCGGRGEGKRDTAKRQLAGGAPPQVRGDDRFRSPFPSTSEPGGVSGTERGQPTVGSGHHVHPVAR